MKVLFYSNAREYTSGEKSFEAETTSSVKTLIDLLGKQYGEKFKTFLLGNNTCFILVNGKGIMTTGGLETPLHPDDKIEVLPLVGGG